MASTSQHHGSWYRPGMVWVRAYRVIKTLFNRDIHIVLHNPYLHTSWSIVLMSCTISSIDIISIHVTWTFPFLRRIFFCFLFFLRNSTDKYVHANDSVITSLLYLFIHTNNRSIILFNISFFNNQSVEFYKNFCDLEILSFELGFFYYYGGSK